MEKHTWDTSNSICTPVEHFDEMETAELIGFRIAGRRTRISKSKSHKYETYTGGRWVGWGAKGMRIKPGTKAGHNFCSRSIHWKGTRGKLARAAWGCRGKRSYKVKRR